MDRQVDVSSADVPDITVSSDIKRLSMMRHPYLYTCDNQFGFKKRHSTDHCIFVLKNAVDYYRSHNSPVYRCMLDATKCFDKINHWTMLKKLIARGIPLIYVRILLFWYMYQTFCVGNITSTLFNVSNGVRQGGMLSPYLFAVYVDDLSVMLNLSNTGLNMYTCMYKMLNHIFYADDLCIMSASPAGLQYILNICEKYASDNDIVFNGKKSVCIVFKPDRYKLKSPDIVLDGAKLEYVENAKHLGVILNKKCQDDNDIQRHIRSLYARANTVIRKFYNSPVNILQDPPQIATEGFSMVLRPEGYLE